MALDLNSCQINVAQRTKELKNLIAFKPLLETAQTKIQIMSGDITNIKELFKQGYKIPSESGYFCGDVLPDVVGKFETSCTNITSCVRQLKADTVLAKSQLDNALYNLVLVVGQYNSGLEENSIYSKINYDSLQVVIDAKSVINEYNELSWNIGGLQL